MIGVILAGGNGTRLKPLTDVTNKHLLPIYDKPMVYYPLETLKELGIRHIIIVTGREFAGDFADLFGDGSEFGINLTYKVQEESRGIAHAVGIVEHIARGEPIIVILGDNIFMLDNKEFEEIKTLVKNFEKNPDGGILFLKKVDDPQRFGVAEIGPNGKIIGIEEKPKKPKSSYATTGLYIYDSTVFDKIRLLKPSHRNEFELTDVNNLYIKEGKLGHHTIRGDWTDAGTFESLHKASILAKHVVDNGSQTNHANNDD